MAWYVVWSNLPYFNYILSLSGTEDNKNNSGMSSVIFLLGF